MRLGWVLLITLTVAIPCRVLATSRALVIGGGLEPKKEMFIPNASNWLTALTRLGWKTDLVFGDPHGVLPSLRDDQVVASSDNVDKALTKLWAETQAGDDVLVMVITHGLVETSFDPKTWESKIVPNQLLNLSDGPMEANRIVAFAKAIRNRVEPGHVIFWNYSCFSGLSVSELAGSGVCGISISGPNQEGIRGNFADILGEILADHAIEDPYIKDVQRAAVKDTSLGSLLAATLSYDRVTPSLVATGFSTEQLNTEDHVTLVQKFRSSISIDPTSLLERDLENFSKLAPGLKVVNKLWDLDSTPIDPFPGAFKTFRETLFRLDPKLSSDIYEFIKTHRRELWQEDSDESDQLAADVPRLVANPKAQAKIDADATHELFEMFNRVLGLRDRSLPENNSEIIFNYVLSIENRFPEELVKLFQNHEDTSGSPTHRPAAGDKLGKKEADAVVVQLRNSLLSEAFRQSTTPCAKFNLDRR